MSSPSITAFTIGSIAGTIGSLVGMGGSFVALPMLTSKRLLAMSQHSAHGTSMATVFFTSIGGCLAYAQAKKKGDDNNENITPFSWDINNLPETVGNVHIPAAFYLATTASVAAIAGARLSKALPAKTLKLSLGVFMLCMVPAAQLRSFLKEERKEKEQQTTVPSSTRISSSESTLSSIAASSSSSLSSSSSSSSSIHPYSPLYLSNIRCAMIGVGSGLLAGLFGVGGGAITVPAMALFTPLDFKTILGTSLACMLPVATTGSITHFMQGTLLPHIGLPLGLGSLTGSYLGGMWSAHIHEDYLRYGYSTLMGILGSRTLYQALRVIK